MPRRDKDDGQPRLASGRQLWRLNQLGRLGVVDEGFPLSSEEAKALIAAEFERSAQSAEQRAASGQ